ncbi:hypothetical protein LTR53_018037 [Teratosphaeriaceae sp. CCFEE 6253]|nr:hypothetical protein LTR53_018037 [Teratosphaeriaceae sp. CCFEE 6253]
MPAGFETRKAKIVRELATPDEQYQALSPQGFVDIGIRHLVSEIIALSLYVTTSSCAGRIAAYLEGSKGAKGAGRWLFTSHDVIDIPEPMALSTRCWGSCRTSHHRRKPEQAQAQHAASAALTAGFRESGITSIVDHSANQTATPMVAVRSSGLAFDCVIGYCDQHSGEALSGEQSRIKLMVFEAHLRTMLEIANQRFTTNEERRERLREALLQS